MEINISEISEEQKLSEYPKDTVFVLVEKERQYDIKTGFPLKTEK